MSDAERGNVGPSEPLSTMLRKIAKRLAPTGLEVAALNEAAARLESAASPPPAPRAAGAGEVVAWAIFDSTGLVWRLYPADEKDIAEKDFANINAVSRYPFTLHALYAGSAPPSGAGVSEEEETPDEIRFRAYYAGYYDALPQPSSTKESDLALAMAEARKYVERHNTAPAPREEI